MSSSLVDGFSGAVIVVESLRTVEIAYTLNPAPPTFTEEAAQRCHSVLYVSNRGDSLVIILQCPTTSTGLREHPRAELATLISLFSLFLSAGWIVCVD